MSPPQTPENSLVPAFFLDSTPAIPGSAFIAPGAVVLGAATLDEQSSIWYHAVVRADIQHIQIGAQSNVQDGAILHVADEFPCIVGERVTIGHRAIVHACRVDDEVLIGMGAIIMDGAHVGARSTIGAGALVTKGMIIPEGSLVVGSPARILRPLSQEERAANARLALKYVEVSRRYMARGMNATQQTE